LVVFFFGVAANPEIEGARGIHKNRVQPRGRAPRAEIRKLLLE
jgi:hypothetical protein